MRALSRTTALACGIVLALPLLAATPAVGDTRWRTVASGLDNPRHLSFSGDTLYIAEAGVGGSGPCVEGAEGPACYGTTGAITRVRHGAQWRVLKGLPSLAGEDGGGALGPTDVTVTGRHRYAVTMGLGNDPAVREELPARGRRLLGTLVTGAFPNAGPRVTADLAAYEARKDPDGAGPDSNPTGMIGGPSRYVVADAGANALLKVRASGRTRVLAVFGSPGTAPAPFPPNPEIPMQSVPTSVAVGPDGAYYVSELTGFPFKAGSARIHRVVPGRKPTVYATGLTNVTDLAWYDGDLYAVQIGILQEGPGSLVKVSTSGAHEVVAGGLEAPYGVAIHDDAAFVTTCSVCANDGAVVRVPLG